MASRDDPPPSEVRQRRKMFLEVVDGERAKGEEGVEDAKTPSPLKKAVEVAAASAAAKEVKSSVPSEMNDSREDEEAAEIKRVLVDQVRISSA